MKQQMYPTIPKEIFDYLRDYLGKQHGEGELDIYEYTIMDGGEKSAGTKMVWEVQYEHNSEIHFYYLKTVTRDREKLQGDESLIAGFRLAHYSDIEWSATGIQGKDDATLYAVGEPDQLFFLERKMEGQLLAEFLQLVENLSDATAMINGVVKWLIKKQNLSDERPHYYVRELFGGSFGILATIDYYPSDLLNAEIAQRYVQYALQWRSYLLDRPMVQIHGDFHPWNIFYNTESHEILTTGALHTPFGAAEDDWCCLGVNLALMAYEQALKSNQELSSTVQWKMLELLEKSAQKMETWASGFFCGWRLMILSNPRHYPYRSRELQKRLTMGALWCLADPKRNRGSIVSLMKRIFSTDNPWVERNPTIPKKVLLGRIGISGQNANQISITEAKSQAGKPNSNNSFIEVLGTVRKIRQHGGITFIDLSSVEVIEKEATLQVIIQQKQFKDSYIILNNSLQVFDRIRVLGVPMMSETGEPSIKAETIEWVSRNLGSLDLARQYEKKSLQANGTSVMLRTTRNVLDESDFHEIWTPSIGKSYGGGTAHAFKTYRRYDARECYLRVTMESLHQELLAGGLPCVYEIGSSFRNESKDRSHLSEFLLLEAYAANRNLTWMEMIGVEIVNRTWMAIKAEEPPKMNIVTVSEALKEFINIDLDKYDLAREQIGKLLNHEISDKKDYVKSLYSLIRGRLRKHFKGIHLLREIPLETTPFTARGAQPTRTWLLVAGTSIADIYLGETRPDIVTDNLSDQFTDLNLVESRDDGNFIKALIAGVPPNVGMGMSLSRLMQILTYRTDIRKTEWWEY